VTIFDEDGKEEEAFAETPIWIDPMGEAEFIVEIPDIEADQLKNIVFCEVDAASPKSCLAWGVVDLMGLSV
jgi:hypothetical protein